MEVDQISVQERCDIVVGQMKRATKEIHTGNLDEARRHLERATEVLKSITSGDLIHMVQQRDRDAAQQ